jgi:hypothetical protein
LGLASGIKNREAALALGRTSLAEPPAGIAGLAGLVRKFDPDAGSRERQ